MCSSDLLYLLVQPNEKVARIDILGIVGGLLLIQYGTTSPNQNIEILGELTQLSSGTRVVNLVGVCEKPAEIIAWIIL